MKRRAPGPRQTAPRHRTARPGVALLTALVVVLLLTWFLSETFFATGLELRSLQAFQDSIRARTLARATLKTVLVGLLQAESDFFAVYQPAQAGLAAVPLEGGRLLELDIRPIDGLYNLNDLAERQPNSAFAVVRHRVFVNLVSRIEIPGADDKSPPTPFPALQASALYAAVLDWTDKDATVFQTPDNALGAEGGDYSTTDPEYVIKNARLDRLEELRLVRGFAESRLPWAEIERVFTVALPRADGTDLYPEKLNVNLASRAEIVAFLQARKVEDSLVASSDVQRAVNDYADKAEAIADALAPEGEQRKPLNAQSLRDALTRAAVTNPNAASAVFVTFSQYYRVRITTEMSDIQARLEAQVYVKRGPDGRGVSAEVLDEVLE